MESLEQLEEEGPSAQELSHEPTTLSLPRALGVCGRGGVGALGAPHGKCVCVDGDAPELAAPRAVPRKLPATHLPLSQLDCALQFQRRCQMSRPHKLSVCLCVCVCVCVQRTVMRRVIILGICVIILVSYISFFCNDTDTCRSTQAQACVSVCLCARARFRVQGLGFRGLWV